MNYPRCLQGFLAAGLLLAVLPAIRAEGIVRPGTKLDALTVGKTTYQRIVVRSVTVHSVVFTYAGGMASIRLRDLPPEWQARFHYNPVDDAAADDADRAKAAALAAQTNSQPANVPSATGMELLLQRFGTPAVIQSEISLRPKFAELELTVKNQGRRPSCAIFAMVSALEYQNAVLTGQVQKFSEEYLLWAARKTTQHTPLSASPDEAAQEDADAGFSLNEVADALRGYGIPPQASMPYNYGEKMNRIADPPPEVIQEARSHQRVSVINLPGRDPATRINNLVQALNAGVPVVVGLAWPNFRSLRSAYLSAQKPMANAGHAVTLVGYQSATGRIEDTVFIFKNSWGVDWGRGGYGLVTYDYISHWLYEAVVLDVQRG